MIRPKRVVVYARGLFTLVRGIGIPRSSPSPSSMPSGLLMYKKGRVVCCTQDSDKTSLKSYALLLLRALRSGALRGVSGGATLRLSGEPGASSVTAPFGSGTSSNS